MLTRTVLGVLMVSITYPTWAEIKRFTSKFEFEAAIKPGYLFADFDGFTYGSLFAPYTQLEQGGFIVTIAATDDYLYSGTGNISTNLRHAALVMTFSGETVTAVGARFFPTDIYGLCRGGKMTVKVNNSEPPIELDTSDCSQFLGITTDGSAITEIKVETDPSVDPRDFPTVDDLYVGLSSDDAVQPIAVAVDIKPGDFPNVINPKDKGVIPVAILTTDSFDASRVNSATVTFGVTGVEALALKAALADVHMDGRPDLVLHFRTDQTGIQCGVASLTLIGLTEKAELFSGTDSIRTTPCK